jgi:hypothetical protein
MSRRAHRRKRERQKKRFALRPKPVVAEQSIARIRTADLFTEIALPITMRAFQAAIREIQRT